MSKERFATDDERVKFFKFYPTPGEDFKFEMTLNSTSERLHPVIYLNKIEGESATLNDNFLEFPTMKKHNNTYGLDAINNIDQKDVSSLFSCLLS